MDVIGTIVEATLTDDKKSVELKIETEDGETIPFTIERGEASSFGLDTKVRVVQKLVRFRSGGGVRGISVPVFGADGEPISDPKSNSPFMSKKGIKPQDWKDRLAKAAKAHGGVASAQQQAKFAKAWRKEHIAEIE